MFNQPGITIRHGRSSAKWGAEFCNYLNFPTKKKSDYATEEQKPYMTESVKASDIIYKLRRVRGQEEPVTVAAPGFPGPERSGPSEVLLGFSSGFLLSLLYSVSCPCGCKQSDGCNSCMQISVYTSGFLCLRFHSRNHNSGFLPSPLRTRLFSLSDKTTGFGRKKPTKNIDFNAYFIIVISNFVVYYRYIIGINFKCWERDQIRQKNNEKSKKLFSRESLSLKNVTQI